MSKIYSRFSLGDMQANYILTDENRMVLVLLPEGAECDLLSEKNSYAYRYGSLAHVHLSHHNEFFYSNCLKCSESVEALHFVSQETTETDDLIKITTTEVADEGYGIEHTLLWHKGDSYVYRTDVCSFSDPTGTQAVLRFAEGDDRALLITHSFKAAKPLEIDIPDGYKIEKSLYSSWAEIKGNKLIITPNTDFEGNVYLLNK